MYFYEIAILPRVILSKGQKPRIDSNKNKKYIRIMHVIKIQRTCDSVIHRLSSKPGTGISFVSGFRKFIVEINMPLSMHYQIILPLSLAVNISLAIAVNTYPFPL